VIAHDTSALVGHLVW